jgi:hypothetical protein
LYITGYAIPRTECGEFPLEQVIVPFNEVLGGGGASIIFEVSCTLSILSEIDVEERKTADVCCAKRNG